MTRRTYDGHSSSGTRGRRLPVMFVLFALVVAMVVAIGVALGGGTAVAKKQPKAQATSDATIEATTFKVADRQYEVEEYAKCPPTSAWLVAAWSRSAQPSTALV